MNVYLRVTWKNGSKDETGILIGVTPGPILKPTIIVRMDTGKLKSVETNKVTESRWEQVQP